MNHPDFFCGVFDNTTTNRREVWREGKLCRYARRECVGHTGSVWVEVHAPWGHYADHPQNASMEIAA